MIKAIETIYNGYRFRSRLEARWAVFFVTLGIEYVYELEGFQLKDGLKYLPDFYLPGLKTWVEVKPFEPTDEEQEKCDLLSYKTGERVWIPFGTIPYPHPSHNGKYGLSGIMTGPELWDMSYWFCVCHFCGAVGIEYEGRSGRIKCGCSHENCSHNDKCRTEDDPKLIEAYRAARQARFEHNERSK